MNSAPRQIAQNGGSIGRFESSSRSAEPMSLVVAAGSASETGPRERNEDYCGFVTPEGPARDAKGVLLALADGVGGARGGRDASEHTVRGLLADYYATSDTWPVPQALDRVLKANNRWLLGRAAAHRELSGMATTLSALVLYGRRYYIAHVGDSRIYLMRGERFERLTRDHVWDREGMRNVLTNAVGLSPNLVMDHAEDALAEGDAFLLASDGVWKPLGDEGMHELLRLHRDPERAAKALVAGALAQGGRDNATAVVARVERLPGADLANPRLASARLAPPPRLAPAQWLDRYEVVELLHESPASLLYKVRDRERGTLAALKTLQPALASDADQCVALLGEEWLAARVVSHYFPQVLPLAAGERSCLYYIMSYHEGATLQRRLDHGEHFSASAAVQLGIRLLKGLSALHRLNIVHRGIRPGNVHIGSDQKLRILDLGAAPDHGAMHEANGGMSGTRSFIAPEVLVGDPVDVRGELYAAGATLYHLLTRKYPYGEIGPFQNPSFGDPVPPTRYRPDIPKWLENLLLKSVAAEPKLRFETAEEFLLALERGERSAILPPARTPLIAYARRMHWRSTAAVSLVLNLLLLYILLAS